MATWTYSGWITQTSLATRLTQLRAHIAEVTEKMRPEISGDGKATSSSALQDYLDTLLAKEKELEDRAQRQGLDGGGGGVSQIRLSGVSGTDGGGCEDY